VVSELPDELHFPFLDDEHRFPGIAAPKDPRSGWDLLEEVAPRGWGTRALRGIHEGQF
jgi:hypothetical protein